jgi:hypothetical protein
MGEERGATDEHVAAKDDLYRFFDDVVNLAHYLLVLVNNQIPMPCKMRSAHSAKFKACLTHKDGGGVPPKFTTAL